ncbi:MAG: hypothetical protein IJQ34_05505 [Kiritimatiellae bacterium]|nr:hypothetical protein [Kiritimatiellia bacterium]
MADGDYEKLAAREAELSRLTRLMKEARSKKSPKALVLGFGASGASAKALLEKQGWRVGVLDEARKISKEEENSLLDGATLAIVSPGLALNHLWLEECRKRKIPLKSELQLGVEELRRRGVKLIAITGSKGKSSIVKLVAQALGGVPCGNYGLPVSAVGETPWAVVEVSSFQMETTNLPPDAFEIAAILNLQLDHLDRHGTKEIYHGLKRKLLGFAKVAISCENLDFASGESLFSGSYFDSGPLRKNAAIAVEILRAAGIDDKSIADNFTSFEPLKHRCQRLGVFDQILYIDDSKATSIAALAAGVEMAPPPVRLIAGGLEKGDDPKDAISSLTRRVKKVYTIGHAAEIFARAWRDSVDCEICGTLENAVRIARQEAEEGETILLSPGAASYDQFKSFGERGDAFADLVKKGKER